MKEQRSYMIIRAGTTRTKVFLEPKDKRGNFLWLIHTAGIEALQEHLEKYDIQNIKEIQKVKVRITVYSPDDSDNYQETMRFIFSMINDKRGTWHKIESYLPWSIM
jgi:hypothetical protein